MFSGESGSRQIAQALLFVLFLGASLLAAAKLYCLFRPLSRHEGEWVEVKRGETALAFVRRLKKRGIVTAETPLLLFLKLSRLDRRLRPARVRIAPGESLVDLVERLTTYREPLERVVIYEGMDTYEIAQRLEELGVCNSTAFLRVATSSQTARRLGLDAPVLEGFLFPDTYFFERGTAPERVAEVMVKNFQKKAMPLLEKSRILDPYRTLIVASMVQKETYIPSEMPKVASVIYNRLEKGMLLQIDPTVIYAKKVAAGRNLRITLGRSDLLFDSPYNTYLHLGLPPAPICNPGLDAIEAAVHPASTHYLYFVAKGDGSHHFSRTLREHMKAVRRYLR